MGHLVTIPGRLNAETYCIILDNLALILLFQFHGVNPCYFHDDNDTCHVARITVAWYDNNGVQQLDWPAQCPDLNPIENLGDELERRLKRCPTARHR